VTGTDELALIKTLLEREIPQPGTGTILTDVAYGYLIGLPDMQVVEIPEEIWRQVQLLVDPAQFSSVEACELAMHRAARAWAAMHAMPRHGFSQPGDYQAAVALWLRVIYAAAHLEGVEEVVDQLNREGGRT
jgi:hypothetical protein